MSASMSDATKTVETKDYQTSAWIEKPRAEWIAKRCEEAARTGDANVSQMHLARKGVVTEEMAYVAQRESLAPELVRD